MNRNKKILIGLLVLMVILFTTSIILSLTGNFIIGAYLVIPMVILIYPAFYLQKNTKDDKDDNSKKKWG